MIFRTLDNVLDKDNKPVRKLALTKVYQTREEVTADGKDPGVYDENKPVKSWAMDKSLFTPDDEDNVLFLGVGLAKDHKTVLVSDGKPFMKPFKVPYEEVGKFNIPPKTAGVPDKPFFGWEYQQPLQVLQSGEDWDWVGFVLPCVRKKPPVEIILPPPGGGSVDFSEVMTKLETIEAKIDQIGALTIKNG